MNKEKAKGTAYETAVAKYLTAATKREVKRNPLAGVNDVGDLAGVTSCERPVCVECKNYKGSHQVTKWMREARREACVLNTDLYVVVAHVTRKSVADSAVYMTTGTLKAIAWKTTYPGKVGEVVSMSLSAFAELIDKS